MKLFKFVASFAVMIVFASLTGCKNTPTAAQTPSIENAAPSTSVTLREGDVVRITFPSAKQLDSSQQIRRDGKIALPSLGEIKAVSLTPAELEKQIVEQFGTQLVSKDVSVAVESAVYPVFVSGAVLKPGKIEAIRPITALEAIMEAGGFDYAKANLKAVKVIRTKGADVQTFLLDLHPVLAGHKSQPFYVQPSDIIFVPEKFTVF